MLLCIRKMGESSPLTLMRLTNVYVRARPYYVFLMIDHNDSTENTTIVECARHFIDAALAWKRGSRKIRKTVSVSKKHVYDWRLEMIIGPFPTRELAEKFKALWMFEESNVKWMREAGVNLALEYKRICVPLRPHLLQPQHSLKLRSKLNDTIKHKQ